MSQSSGDSKSDSKSRPSRSQKRLAKEFKKIKKTPLAFASVDLKNDNLFNWTITLAGPSGTPWAGGSFLLDFVFPPEYPMKPPTVSFATPIYHPSVSMEEKGAVCGDVTGKDWAPTLRAIHVLERINEMLANPTGDHPLDAEIGETFSTNRQAFDRTAREWTRKHAT